MVDLEISSILRIHSDFSSSPSEQNFKRKRRVEKNGQTIVFLDDEKKAMCDGDFFSFFFLAFYFS